MKVYIQTDMEGVAGFTSFEDMYTPTVGNYEHRQRMYRLLTGEVNAAVKAAKACGAEKIYINDSHGSGYNILFEELDRDCEIMHGRNGFGPAWLPSLDEGFDAMVLVGMHAMGGVLDAVCPHSKWEVNGGKIYLSEGSMAMALAGDMGIPTVFVSGDQYITAELKDKNPGIEVAVVKHSYAPNFCRSKTPARVRELISEGVTAGLNRIKEIPPYRLSGPLTLNLLDAEDFIPPLKSVLKKPVHGRTITECFEKANVQFPWVAYGRKIMDYYRYPDNLSGKKPDKM